MKGVNLCLLSQFHCTTYQRIQRYNHYSFPLHFSPEARYSEYNFCNAKNRQKVMNIYVFVLLYFMEYLGA